MAMPTLLTSREPPPEGSASSELQPLPEPRTWTLGRFLESFIAREVIEGLAGSAEQRCQRLIDYAENDA